MEFDAQLLETQRFFSKLGKQYDALGNDIATQIAKAYGYSLPFAKFGAGVAQIYDGTSSWSYYRSWFDDPRDALMITRGYRHW